MRRAAKVDANHGEIVDALRAIGCSVLSLAKLGDGAPDLLVGRNYQNVLLEIKDGSLAPSKRKLRPDQEKFHSEWRGQVCTVGSVDEAIKWVKIETDGGI